MPNPDDAQANATFQAWAAAEWRTRRGGPQSQTVGNTAGLLPLRVLSPGAEWARIVGEYTGQDARQFLPRGYTAEQVAGYEAQRRVLAASMARADNAVLELPLQATGTSHLLLTKQVSRGTILLNASDVYAEPVVDYHTLVNPVDARVAVAALRFVRRWHAEAAAMQALGAAEVSPGAAQYRTDAELLEVVRRTTGSTAAHLSGTNAMLPRAWGGVVDSELRVYGVTGLSVADASMMPLIVGAHLCATVYAVAEKVSGRGRCGAQSEGGC